MKTAYLRYIFERFVEYDLNDDHQNRANFLYELHRARHLNFTDDRDHIFAWLGHYSFEKSNTALSALVADYTKNLNEIYYDMAKRALEDGKAITDGTGLIALAAIQHMQLPSSDKTTASTVDPDILPSWVPDWRTYQSHMLSEPINAHCAHGATTPKLSFNTGARSLIIHGVEVDTIEACSRPLESKEFHPNQGIAKGKTAIEYIWQDICQKEQFNLSEKYVNGESSFFACMQTLGNGCVSNGQMGKEAIQ